jgi:membrane protease YdiL (CAAX protease family)
VFAGFLYGQFDRVFPGRLGTKFPLSRALLWTAPFFALWHVPNLEGMSFEYVTFQLAHTASGFVASSS